VEGPFSLRPSREAYEMATTAMARVPSGPRASDAADLLRLPTSRTTRRVRRSGSFVEALRTFTGTLAVGFGLAAGIALGIQHAARAREGEKDAARAVTAAAASLGANMGASAGTTADADADADADEDADAGAAMRASGVATADAAPSHSQGI